MHKADSQAAFESSVASGGGGSRAQVVGLAPRSGADVLPGGVRLVDDVGTAAARARRAVARMSDRQLALAIGGVLFALGAWPLALTEVPPYQDLPNHLAALTVLNHPGQYPEFVANGFLKTNAALFTWLFFASKVVSPFVAAKIFTLGVLAMNALVIPRVVLDLTGSRKKLLVASLFAWPMIHNWFVSMGMLDFALGFPLSLLLILLLHEQARAPSWRKVVLIALAGIATWYAHVFALLVALMLAFIQVVTQPSWRGRAHLAKVLALPLGLVAPFAAVSLYTHAVEPDGAMHGWVKLTKILPTWELFYNLWAEFLWGFTKLSISSFVVAVGLGVIAWYRRHERIPFFSPLAFLALGVLYFFMPYTATNWFHVNSRFIPFLWICALVRVPESLPHPRKATALLVLSAVLYSLGMGVDFVRLEHDRQKFVAGIAHVPQGAKLLPILFRRQVTSENTRSLLHAWGFYVAEKQTSAPLLFAHSRSFPVMYKEAPPARFNHLVLEGFGPNMANAEWMCADLRTNGIVSDCESHFQMRWAEFWRDATPVYDHVLMWDAPPEALAQVPPAYRVKFRQDRLVIYERVSN